ncbi:MAG TPA: hypothetical protein VME66_13845 [Candidatus Acidoferrales bacterium]|nr:hypothetical protein [Candidatus Acidoferrales bacterium]
MPTASPTATPTPVPTAPGVLNVAPTALPIYGTGAANANTLTVSESGYAGTFSENDTCSSVATIATSNASGPTATYTVTGVGAGTCNVTFEDSFAQQASASITVTTTGFTVSSHGRKGH